MAARIIVASPTPAHPETIVWGGPTFPVAEIMVWINAVPTDDPCGSWCQTTCSDPLASRSNATWSMFAPVGAVTGSQ